MNYKVGDKFVIEIEDVDEYGYYIKDFGVVTNHHVLGRLPQLVNGVDMACYNKGMEDAWRIAERLHRMNPGEVQDIFSPDGKPFYMEAEDVIRMINVYTVKEKLEAYDDKICIGDEVELIDFKHLKFIVVEIEDGCVNGIGADGVRVDQEIEHLRKTGNNYATELRELLDKIGGESE